MYKKFLDNFFKKNELDSETPSAQALANFKIGLLQKPEINNEINKLMSEQIHEDDPLREERVISEQNLISEIKTGDEILYYMRKNTDNINDEFLLNKAIEFKSEILFKVLKLLKTSLNDYFIENAIRFFILCEQNVSPELIGCYDEIRNPYAKSQVLVTLGFIADEKDIPWICDQYFTLKAFSDETYCEGAYYALLEMYDRFYAKK